MRTKIEHQRQAMYEARKELAGYQRKHIYLKTAESLPTAEGVKLRVAMLWMYRYIKQDCTAPGTFEHALDNFKALYHATVGGDADDDLRCWRRQEITGQNNRDDYAKDWDDGVLIV
jgi:hypothetical protein